MECIFSDWIKRIIYCMNFPYNTLPIDFRVAMNVENLRGTSSALLDVLLLCFTTELFERGNLT